MVEVDQGKETMEEIRKIQIQGTIQNVESRVTFLSLCLSLRDGSYRLFEKKKVDLQLQSPGANRLVDVVLRVVNPRKIKRVSDRLHHGTKDILSCP